MVVRILYGLNLRQLRLSVPVLRLLTFIEKKKWKCVVGQNSMDVMFTCLMLKSITCGVKWRFITCLRCSQVWFLRKKLTRWKHGLKKKTSHRRLLTMRQMKKFSTHLLSQLKKCCLTCSSMRRKLCRRTVCVIFWTHLIRLWNRWCKVKKCLVLYTESLQHQCVSSPTQRLLPWLQVQLLRTLTLNHCHSHVGWRFDSHLSGWLVINTRVSWFVGLHGRMILLQKN